MATQTACKHLPNKLFIPIQHGVFEHIGDGRMTISMWAIYSVMLKEADYNTGIWMGCAEKARAAWNYDLPLRTAQRTIQALCDRRYVKSFRQNGQRKNQPFLIHKYPVRFGANRGKMLNAIATADPEYPVYEHDSRQTDRDADHDNDAVNGPASTTEQKASPSSDHDTSAHSVGPRQAPRHDHVSDRDTTASATAPKHPLDLASIPEVPEVLEVLDVPEVARNQEQHQQQHQTEGLVGGDGGASPISKLNPLGQGSAENGLGRESFLKEQAKLFQQSCLSGRTRPSHLEESWQMAQKHGVPVYLAGLNMWLEKDDDELVISQEQDPRTGKYKTIYRSWPLKTFLDSPTALIRMDKVRPFIERYGVSGDVLSFLLDFPAPDDVLDLTPGQIAALQAAVEDNYAAARLALEEMNYSEAFFDDPSSAIERFNIQNRARIVQKMNALNVDRVYEG